LTPGNMLRGLLDTLTFTDKTAGVVKFDGEADRPVVVLDGRWRKQVIAALLNSPSKTSTDDIGGNAPQFVRLSLDEKTKWPVKMELYRKDKAAEYSPLLVMEFRELKVGEKIPDSAFQYTPPEDLIAEDATVAMLERFGQLKDKAGAAAETGAAVSAPIARPGVPVPSKDAPKDAPKEAPTEAAPNDADATKPAPQ
ncbi:MAG: hypothetical protein ACRDD1_08695, partial [Planctomycetia bacterium]